MKDYKKLINPESIPEHVAIIMDGNGRWAKKRSLPRSEGHKKGSEIVETVVDTAVDMGIRVLSLYAFSVENWSRPLSEIRGLWSLLEYYFDLNLEKMQEQGIRIKHSGSIQKLPGKTKKQIQRAVDATSKNKRLVLNFCINYGGRQEIVNGVNNWLDSRKSGEKLTEKKLKKYLFSSDIPDVDLLIRTSGEYRISNFMLWQLAYSELVFMDVLWPDFKPEHLYESVYEFQQRERRFGGI